MDGKPSLFVSATRLGVLNPAIDLSIIIVNWNTNDLLRQCLESIRQNSGHIRMETLVVDNGSRDGSADMVAHDFPDVRLLINDRNVGFAAANNRGLAQAHGRYMLLLNSDTVVLPDALEGMVRHMDTHPSVGAVGPRLLNADGSVQVSAHDFPRLDHDAVMLLEVKHWPLLGDLARRYARRAYGPQHQETREVDWVMGACLMVRRTAIEQTGLLDEGYFFFFEESDLCYRLRQHGWPTVFLAESEVVHLGGQSRARVPAASLVWYYRGLLRFYRLHGGARRRLLVRIAVVAGAAGHVAWRLLWPRWTPASGPALAAYARILGHALQG